MGSIGPELPSYIPTKRKHDQEGTGISTKPKKEALSHSSSPESVGKRRRVIGPALPPAPLDERPPHQSEDSSSDEDYGPTLPQNNHNDAARTPAVPTFDTANIAEPEKTQRDEWMMIPPKQDDLSARMDPTQIRARKFNTGKAAKVVSQKGGDNTVWTETPEQKRKRLDDQVLGNTQSAVTDTDAAMQRNHRVENDERARRIREHNVRYALRCSNQAQSSDLFHRRSIGVSHCMTSTRDHQRRKRKMLQAREVLTTRRIWEVA